MTAPGAEDNAPAVPEDAEEGQSVSGQDGQEPANPTEETGAMDQVTAEMADATPPESPEEVTAPEPVPYPRDRARTPEEVARDRAELSAPEPVPPTAEQVAAAEAAAGIPVERPMEPIVIGSLEFKRRQDGRVGITQLVGGVAHCIAVLKAGEWGRVVEHLGL